MVVMFYYWNNSRSIFSLGSGSRVLQDLQIRDVQRHQTNSQTGHKTYTKTSKILMLFELLKGCKIMKFSFIPAVKIKQTLMTPYNKACPPEACSSACSVAYKVSPHFISL
jgi:hypothetical protein